MDGSISFTGLLNGSIAEGGGGGGSTVEITPVVTSGTKIADVSVNGVEKDLYCPTPPTPQEVIITPVVTSGTKIADVSVNGVEKDLHCPTPTEVNVTQVQSSGTKIASIEVNEVNTDIYAPEGGGGVIYSLTEHIVGKWLDGRNVYERTYNVGSVSIGSFGTVLNLDNLNEIDKVLYMQGISLSVNESMDLMGYFDGKLLAYFYRTENVEYITLRYIKAT